MANLNDMIETILIKEISLLYKLAESPVGLSLEDVRKLEIYCKIKDLERSAGEPPKLPEPGKVNISDLLKALRDSKPVVNDE